MEGPHRKLGPRLADRLRRDDADSLAHIDRRAARKVAAIAFGANPELGLAGQDRADTHLRHPRRFDLLDMSFKHLLTGGDDDRPGCRILDVFRRGSAEHALPERGNHLAGIDDRTCGDRGLGTAVIAGNDAVLGNVDETASEITRIGRLEGGIRETLSSAVRRVEIFEHGQAFLEV